MRLRLDDLLVKFKQGLWIMLGAGKGGKVITLLKAALDRIKKS